MQEPADPMHGGEIRFGRFRLELNEPRLMRADQPVRLPARVLQILCVLAAAGGEVVSKDELMQRVWPGRVVEENNLYVHVSTLRRALNGDDGEGHVMTVPGRGYRLIGVQAAPFAENQKRSSLALPDKPSVAVLPFKNMNGDPEQEYLVDGITEDIITALAKWRWFFVTARNSSFTYKGRAVDVREVGRELGVRYIVEGSVRVFGNCIRINAQLVEASTAHQVWAELFEFDRADLTSVHDELTQKISAAIEPAVAQVEIHRAQYKDPQQLLAWDHYLRGLSYLNRQTPEDARSALSHFREAAQLDANLAEAHVGIARAYHTEYGYGLAAGRSPTNTEAAEAARAALERDESSCYAHYILALVAAHDGDLDAAVRAARRAIDLNTNFALGYFALAVGALYRGEPEEALAAVDIALRLSPHDPQVFLWLALRG
jgi:adenylate cyclase